MPTRCRSSADCGEHSGVRRRPSSRSLPTRIRFDDSTSDRFTIITIFTYDRRGLLYSITRTLFECGLVVHVAKIATYLDQVVDAFYVTNAKGQKIHSPQQLSEIRQRLTAALEPAASPPTDPPLTRRQGVSTIAYLYLLPSPQPGEVNQIGLHDGETG